MATIAHGARSRTSVSPQSIPAIIADALRAAALAPTDREALDVLGATLVRLADLSRMEVRHA